VDLGGLKEAQVQSYSPGVVNVPTWECTLAQPAAGGFAALHKLRCIWRSVLTSVYQTLIVLLVVSRLDYGNAALVGIPANLSRHLVGA